MSLYLEHKLIINKLNVHTSHTKIFIKKQGNSSMTSEYQSLSYLLYHRDCSEWYIFGFNVITARNGWNKFIHKLECNNYHNLDCVLDDNNIDKFIEQSDVISLHIIKIYRTIMENFSLRLFLGVSSLATGDRKYIIAIKKDGIMVDEKKNEHFETICVCSCVSGLLNCSILKPYERSEIGKLWSSISNVYIAPN